MKVLVLASALALTACTIAPGQSPRSEMRTSADFPKPLPFEQVRLNRPQAIDGDTLRADDFEVRLSKVDTPEIFSNSRCREEKAAGIVARDFAQQRLDAAKEVIAVVSPEKDKYGRTIASVLVDGRDLSDALSDAGLAMPYRNGGYVWCPDPSNPVPRSEHQD